MSLICASTEKSKEASLHPPHSARKANPAEGVDAEVGDNDVFAPEVFPGTVHLLANGLVLILQVAPHRGPPRRHHALDAVGVQRGAVDAGEVLLARAKQHGAAPSGPLVAGALNLVLENKRAEQAVAESLPELMESFIDDLVGAVDGLARLDGGHVMV